MTRQYDVQVMIDGEWQWGGVAPTPMTQRKARHVRSRMALDPYWREIGVTRMRVARI